MSHIPYLKHRIEIHFSLLGSTTEFSQRRVTNENPNPEMSGLNLLEDYGPVAQLG